MRDPVSLRNIPEEVLSLADTIHRHTGLSMSDVLRLALVSGILIEVTKIAPDHNGNLCGLEGADLAKALRRHLGSAIDLLLEHGQHPYQMALGSSNATPIPLPSTATVAGNTTPPGNICPTHSIADDLDALGIGLGFSEGLGNYEVSS
ncbi:MAG TPA: hypothetical protein VFB12_05650 [Ktedonobacteraceae bacterium]|nr:hypothetical protein [Ktedonobacteraceae bacterium]